MVLRLNISRVCQGRRGCFGICGVWGLRVKLVAYICTLGCHVMFGLSCSTGLSGKQEYVGLGCPKNSRRFRDLYYYPKSSHPDSAEFGNAQNIVFGAPVFGGP